ncbi:MAG: hypothetical protein FJZ60_01225 [Chlamydiae bacterium]|nr:hypothetical protein [Chlamydiota bacterium]
MATVLSSCTKDFKEPLLPTSNSPLKASDTTNKKIRQFVGSALEQTFPLGDGVAIVSLSEKMVTQASLSTKILLQDGPLNADVANYSASAVGGLTGIFGVIFHSMNLNNARKRSDTEGIKIFSSQVVRFVAKKAAVATQIASLILSRSGEALAMSLQKASSYLGAISTASGTIAFSFRLYDKHQLKKLNGDVKKIREQYLKLSESENQASDPQAILAGKVDRLGRALGSRSLAEKIQNAKGDELSSEIIQKVTKSHKNDAICLGVFIITDIVNIISIAIPIIKMVGMGLSLAVNFLWLTAVDGKFFIEDLKDKKEISTALKVAYVAQIVLSVTSIVASSVFTFGAIPIAIGLASVLMSAIPFLIRYFHQKKQQKALEGPQAEKPVVKNPLPDSVTAPKVDLVSPSSTRSAINKLDKTRAGRIQTNSREKNWGIRKKVHPGWVFF